MTKYAVVTAVSQFRIRYVIPMDELQKLNPEAPVELQWAEDCVTCEEVKDFSQKHLGETIIDTVEMSEDEVLEFFDADNGYLSEWPREQKLKWIRAWKIGKDIS